MPSLISILFRLFLFNIKDFLVLMIIFFFKFDGDVSNFLVILLNIYVI